MKNALALLAVMATVLSLRTSLPFGQEHSIVSVVLTPWRELENAVTGFLGLRLAFWDRLIILGVEQTLMLYFVLAAERDRFVNRFAEIRQLQTFQQRFSFTHFVLGSGDGSVPRPPYFLVYGYLLILVVSTVSPRDAFSVDSGRMPQAEKLYFTVVAVGVWLAAIALFHGLFELLARGGTPPLGRPPLDPKAVEALAADAASLEADKEATRVVEQRKMDELRSKLGSTEIGFYDPPRFYNRQSELSNTMDALSATRRLDGNLWRAQFRRNFFNSYLYKTLMVYALVVGLLVVEAWSGHRAP